MTEVKLPIIGYMHSPYREKFGIPRQPNLVNVESYIEMCEPYNNLQAFEGLDTFSHLWLIWQFHENKNTKDAKQFRAQVRPPRLGGNEKIGVFATRSMYRPSPIGLSVVKFKEIKKVGQSVRVYVSGSDLLHGTPILDLKPYIQYSDAVVDAQSGYAQIEPVKKLVIWESTAEIQKQQFLMTQRLTLQLIDELEQILALDPRPAYQHDEDRIYGMLFSNINIKFKCKNKEIHIMSLQET